MVIYAVGSLVRTRGREWIVLPGSEEDLLRLQPLGGDEEDVAGVLPGVEKVEPATLAPPSLEDLGDDNSARLLRSTLRLGFRASGGPFRSLAGIAVSPRPYQLVPLLMALRQPVVRLLISDDVGIGKTVEVGLIAAELRAQGAVQRMAVLCSPHLAPQWQAELRDKFGIEAAVVLPRTVRRLEHGLPYDRRLWDHYPHVVVSTDFIKQRDHRDGFVANCPELLIVDEAHTCVEAGAGTGRGGSHKRYELLQRLAARQDRHLILVTATPHSGNPEAFRNLLGLLDPWLGKLPDNLTGVGNRPQRERLARYFIQRRRGDIRDYLDEQTRFPERLPSEEVYEPEKPYRRLFDQAVDYAREFAGSPDGESATRQRVRWWSMLALLRCLASSPAAAVATARNRTAAAEARNPEEADDLGRQSVLDSGDDEAPDGLDTTPGAIAADGSGAEADAGWHRRLRDLAAAAGAIAPEHDAKLVKAIAVVRSLLQDRFDPIVFCRYIPTAEYVAKQMARALGRGDVAVAAVTGMLPPAERERRIAKLGETGGRRVLVATDCLAEGLNLQERFNAVVHYDLAWNPTRHEQREGRVDRFAQRLPEVRTVTLYGNNPVDPIVIRVLLRKHEAIRSALGVSVPVPSDSNAVIEAVMEDLLLRGHEQLSLDLFPEQQSRREQLHAAWDRAKEREERSRSLYAQHVISKRTVAAELAAVRKALGDGYEVRRFVHDAVDAMRGRVHDIGDDLWVNVATLPQPLRDALPGVPTSGPDADLLRFRPEPLAGPGEAVLARTDPAVEAIAQYVLDTALDPTLEEAKRPARRCGVLRTGKVTAATTLLLVRFRFHLRLPPSSPGGPPITQVAEEARMLGFRGFPDAPEWIGEDEVESLLEARPEQSRPAQAEELLRRRLSALDRLTEQVEAAGQRVADGLYDAHRRVRETGGAPIRGLSVELQPPADILGVYLYLPRIDLPGTGRPATGRP